MYSAPISTSRQVHLISQSGIRTTRRPVRCSVGSKTWELVSQTLLEPLSNQEQAVFLGTHVLNMIVLPVLAGVTFYYLLRKLADKAQKVLDKHSNVPPIFEMVPLALAAPARVLLPPVILVTTFRNLVYITDLYLHEFKPRLVKWADPFIHNLCSSLNSLDSLLLRGFGVILIVFGAWTLLAWKHVALETLMRYHSRGQIAPDVDLPRILLPLSGVADWLVALTAMLMILQALGMSIHPLLATGGVTAVVAGLASQQLLANIFSGLSIFVARPFVEGDSVAFQSAGVMVGGTVEKVLPLRTVIRTTEDVVIAVPNKMVSDMVIHNYSKPLAFKATKPQAYRFPRQGKDARLLRFKVKLDRKDFDKFDQVKADIKEYLQQCPSVDQREDYLIEVAQLTESGVEMAVKCKLLNNDMMGDLSAMERALLGLATTVHGLGARVVSV